MCLRADSALLVSLGTLLMSLKLSSHRSWGTWACSASQVGEMEVTVPRVGTIEVHPGALRIWDGF